MLIYKAKQKCQRALILYTQEGHSGFKEAPFVYQQENTFTSLFSYRLDFTLEVPFISIVTCCPKTKKPTAFLIKFFELQTNLKYLLHMYCRH